MEKQNKQIAKIDNESQYISAKTEQVDEAQAASFIDLLDIWTIIKQQKWLILFIMILVVSATAAYTFKLIIPTYQSSAVILIKEKKGQIEGLAALAGKGAETEESIFVRTQYEMIRNRVLAERVVDELDLREELTKKAVKQSISSAEDVFLSDLSMVPIERTNLVKINYEANSPELAAKVVNTIIAMATTLQLEALDSSNDSSINYLEKELSKARKSLTRSETKMVSYANKQGILSIDKNQVAPLSRLTELYKALGLAATTRIQAESTYQEAKNNKNAPEIQGNAFITSLKTRLSTLEIQYQEKSQLFKPDYPEMLMLSGQIGDVKRKIQTQTGNAQSGLKARYLATKDAESKVALDVKALEKELMKLQDKSVEYNTLQREVNSRRKLYEELLQKFQEIKISAKIDANYIKVIDPAIPPVKQYRPKPVLNIVVGSIIGLFLGIAIGFLRNSASKKLTSTRMLQKSMGFNILGTIPEIKSLKKKRKAKNDDENNIATSPNSAVAQAYRILSTTLNNTQHVETPKVMMVTSANMSEGKSTVALNLAYAQATAGSRVLIVDADLRRPSLHKKTGLKNAYGFSDYLSGNLEYTKIIQTHADQKGLYVMTAGHLSRDPTKLLASKKLATFLTHASEYFDQIIIDTPPVIGFADTLILASAVDGVLFIVDESNMDKDKIQNSLAQLSRIRKNILGFVVTKAKQDVLTNDYYKEYYASRNKKKGLFGRSKPDGEAV